MAIPYYANANRGPAEMIVWVPTTRAGATRPTIASLSTPTASHCFANDTVDAMNDGVAPRNSSDEHENDLPGGTGGEQPSGYSTTSASLSGWAVRASTGGTTIDSAATAPRP